MSIETLLLEKINRLERDLIQLKSERLTYSQNGPNVIHGPGGTVLTQTIQKRIKVILTGRTANNPVAGNFTTYSWRQVSERMLFNSGNPGNPPFITSPDGNLRQGKDNLIELNNTDLNLNYTYYIEPCDIYGEMWYTSVYQKVVPRLVTNTVINNSNIGLTDSNMWLLQRGEVVSQNASTTAFVWEIEGAWNSKFQAQSGFQCDMRFTDEQNNPVVSNNWAKVFYSLSETKNQDGTTTITPDYFYQLSPQTDSNFGAFPQKNDKGVFRFLVTFGGYTLPPNSGIIGIFRFGGNGGQTTLCSAYMKATPQYPGPLTNY